MILSTLSFMVLYVKVNEEWLTFKRKDNQILLHTSSKLEKDSLVFVNELLPSFLLLLKLCLSVDST